MKTGEVEEAEDLLKEDNGSKGTTAKCEAHSGHTLDDEDLYPASVEGIRVPPCTHLQFVMDLVNRLGTDKERRVDPPATLPGTSDREEVSSHPVNRAANDDGHPNPTGRRLFDNAVLKTRGEILNIGTWNIRTLYQSGKLDNATQEMNRMSIDILGLSEVRWVENGRKMRDK